MNNLPVSRQFDENSSDWEGDQTETTAHDNTSQYTCTVTTVNVFEICTDDSNTQMNKQMIFAFGATTRN